MNHDICIIGGGIVGSSVAYHLTRTGRTGSVCVVEPDPTYEWASTPRGSGGIRQLFSLPENIGMAQYGLRFYTDFPQAMAVDGESAAIDFRRQGYLFLAKATGARQLEANHRTQVTHGAKVDLLDPAGIKARFPSLAVDDIALGAHSPDDGWIDPHAALQGFRRKARSLGATYRKDRVVGLDVNQTAVRVARLASGERIAADVFVNTAGPWAGEVASMAGVGLPVEPMSRLNHYFEVRAALEPLPFVKEEPVLAFRPEGAGFIGGMPQWEVAAGFNWEIDEGHFERLVWPALARRVPAFEALRLKRTWVGHYERNSLDANAIIGRCGQDNFFTASGFSGHGIMQAPAAGRALAELILDGRFETLDLARLSYQRVLDGTPYPEQGII